MLLRLAERALAHGDPDQDGDTSVAWIVMGCTSQRIDVTVRGNARSGHGRHIGGRAVVEIGPQGSDAAIVEAVLAAVADASLRRVDPDHPRRALSVAASGQVRGGREEAAPASPLRVGGSLWLGVVNELGASLWLGIAGERLGVRLGAAGGTGDTGRSLAGMAALTVRLWGPHYALAQAAGARLWWPSQPAPDPGTIDTRGATYDFGSLGVGYGLRLGPVVAVEIGVHLQVGRVRWASGHAAAIAPAVSIALVFEQEGGRGNNGG